MNNSVTSSRVLHLSVAASRAGYSCLSLSFFSRIFCCTCSSPPGQAWVLRACDGARAATAAPWPASGVQRTERAWPAAGGLRTSVAAARGGMEYRRLGGAASRVHAGCLAERWGWRRGGKGSEPDEGLRGGLPGDGPQSLEDTLNTPHLGEEGLAGGGVGVSEYASAGGGVA